MLRIHFTDRDLALTRVAAAPDPLWETVLSLHMLGPAGRHLPAFTSWRTAARRKLRDRDVKAPLHFLHALAAPGNYFPDLLTPAEADGGLDDGLAAVEDTAPERFRAEITRLSAVRPLPRWTDELCGGDRRRARMLSEALRRAHEALVAPHVREVHTHVDADRSIRARAACDGGSHGLLHSLRPVLRWDPPVLSADYPVTRELHLDGRGLRLVPSYFCWGTPVTFADPDLPPTLVYPVSHDLADSRPTNQAALTALLGRTRASVLHASTDTSTTGELARRLGISPAAVSRHTAALRDAGLLTSQRQAAIVLHRITPLGGEVISRCGFGPPEPNPHRLID
ncbi:helix-turn-helix domain-containing protein [Allokutzneria sp. A3M-2-11 16]|uniref:ArsR/SmtB family transcription factor n=1 Tax=Allokutzneria sp. A3M-2-11 16 TaxID=2962043 RepID=UPI0020B71AB2|nr:helix-turn-helix domain-containing protein [Allokutzneria sp. A3M-2-11 16]MCP3801319.1 helix-turn-helix domain-containing protein [Allokutzneria sp. A3M-2-11 16]